MCERCGIMWEPGNRKRAKWCPSCRTRRSSTVGDCIPWQGNFGYDMVTPVTDTGQIVKPGVRLCGHADCVNSGHIVKINEEE